jgi:hypothetical protein
VEGNYPPVAMIELSAKPERTYALVVGIEKYQESHWNVGGQADDAIKFAQWLGDRGVPRDNIRLCLSPLEEIEHSELTIEEATEHKIADLITGWLSEKQGDLLYLFWAGHGLITSTRNRRLLCADATKQNWQNLDLDSLLTYLSSDRFKIQRHICIIDACANYILESHGRPTNLGGKTFPSGKPRTEIQQFVLLAAGEGETAKVNTGEKTGYFSQVVREALTEESNGKFPPNMEAIAEKVKQRFETLDKKQMPTSTYLHHQGWDGDKEDYYFNQPSPKNSNNDLSVFSETPVFAQKINELNDTDLETLADILKRSGRVSKINSRRALCISIQLDPSDIDFIENSSARDFATQLVSQLSESRNFPALSKLCETITPSVPGFKSELNSIQKKYKL